MKPLRRQEEELEEKLNECKSKRDILLKELKALEGQIANFEDEKRTITTSIEDYNEDCRRYMLDNNNNMSVSRSALTVIEQVEE